MRRYLSILFLVLLSACSPREQGLEGQLLFQGRPLAGAQLEVYLKNGSQRSSSPFTQGLTDASGRYRVLLPAGEYYLVGRMKQQAAGVNRMLMAEAPANPYLVEGKMRGVEPFELREMGLGGSLPEDPHTWAEGRLVSGGEPLADGFVYVYMEDTGDLIGPSYAKVVQADESGAFRLELPAGRYWLAARKRTDGARSGSLSAGDYNGRYQGNPLVLASGDQRQLGDLSLSRVDGDRNRQRVEAGTFSPTDTSCRGRVLDEEGRPLKGVYVYAYADSRMIGKPAHISAPTGIDGRFELFLAGGGRYYIGARSAFGGPLEPGERVGTYEGEADHGVSVEKGSRRDLGDILAKEVW